MQRYQALNLAMITDKSNHYQLNNVIDKSNHYQMNNVSQKKKTPHFFFLKKVKTIRDCFLS